MIGKKAQDFLEKYKDIIDKVILIDYESWNPGIKCLYFYTITEALNARKWKDSLFKDDNGDWDSYDNECYTILKGTTLKNHEDNLEIDIVVKRYEKNEHI